METYLTPSNITFVLGLGGLAFTIWGKVTTPLATNDKRDALLSQEIEWQRATTNDRFKMIQDSFNALLLQSNNHIHTVDIKVETLTATVSSMSNELTKLRTIIEERIPKQ